jgi:hypothetical protein
MKPLKDLDDTSRKLVMTRIQESRGAYDRKKQRAELLIRNPEFIKEYKELQDQIINEGFAEAFWPYESFCMRWGLDRRWHCSIPSISEFIRTTPLLVYNPKWVSNSEEYPSIGFLPNEKNSDFLFVKIDPWINLKDVEEAWPQVENLKKRIFDYSEKGKSGFGRDLCWYDLNKTHHLSPGKIACLWSEFCPKDIDLLVMKRIKRDEADLLREEDVRDLLAEIKNDPSMSELRGQFELERKLYVKGPGSSFRLAVRESIKRMGRYIKRVKPAQ